MTGLATWRVSKYKLWAGPVFGPANGFPARQEIAHNYYVTHPDHGEVAACTSAQAGEAVLRLMVNYEYDET